MIICKIYRKQKEYLSHKNELLGILASIFNKPSTYRPFEIEKMLMFKKRYPENPRTLPPVNAALPQVVFKSLLKKKKMYQKNTIFCHI